MVFTRLCLPLLGVCLLSLSASAVATEPAAAPAPQAALSAPGTVLKMWVTGSIDIDPAGKVLGYRLDDAEQLAPAVVELVARQVPTWQFEPLPASQTQADPRTPMRLYLEAEAIGPDSFAIALRSASFLPKYSEDKTDRLRWKHRQPIEAPDLMYRRGFSGVVYVMLRIGRKGRALDAYAEQVDLQYTAASEKELKTWRSVLTRTVLDHIRKSSFRIPTTGPEADLPEWVARVEYVFSMDTPLRMAGRWDHVIPGPRSLPDWAQQHTLARLPPDATASSSLTTGREQRQLSTPLAPAGE